MAPSATNDASPDAEPPAKEKITLTGAQETLLLVLQSKAKDSKSAKPILNDTWAMKVLDRLDYDFNKVRLPSTTDGIICLRSNLFDTRTAEFLDTHPVATVLHLACGLDSRCLRLQRYLSANSVRWIDVDLPDVVALRRKVLPSPSGDYQLLAASAADPAWIEGVPADRPTLIIMEGLSMYLTKEAFESLIKALVGHFGAAGGGQGGLILFDAINWFIKYIQGIIFPLKKTTAVFDWVMDDPKELEAWADGLKLREARPFPQFPGVENLPLLQRYYLWSAAWIPGWKNIGRWVLYDF